MFRSIFQIVVFAIGIFLLSACASWFQKASTNPILAPIAAGLCDGETALDTGYANWLSAKCGGPATASATCVSTIQSHLGALNLCTTPVPAPAGLASVKAVGGKFTFGDIHKGDIEQAKIAMAAHAMGLSLGPIGTVICPIGDAGFVTLVSNILLTSDTATACGCTGQLDDPNIDADVVAVCTAVLNAL